MTDFDARRTLMVDTQVRPSDVTKFPVIEAMLRVPREAFVPADRVEAAYAGANLPLAPGRVVLEPRTLAKMLDAVNPGPDELVLDVGCGLGYSTAVVARLGQAVIGVEEDAAMAADARATLDRLGFDNATVIEAPLTEGAPRHGPYDVLLVQGGIERLPETLAAQLRPGGRIGAVFMDGALGVCRLGLRRGDGVVWRDAFNASAPVLPGFARPRSFSL